jgi:predicted NBD/HSP70 family sugar kinase
MVRTTASAAHRPAKAMVESNGARSGLTRTAILALLGQHGPASRATIARELELSAATVSQVTKQFIHEGLVEPLEYAPSGGGRPGQLLGLVSEAGRAVGVKLAADHLVLVDVRLDGRVVSSRTEAFDALAEGAVGGLVSSIGRMLRRGTSRTLGVGVAVPGTVERPDVGVVDAEVLGWTHKPLGDALRNALGVPVLVENDVRALAVAERLYGRGRNRESFVVITIGRGIGFANVADGKLQRGARGGAGELAHVVVGGDGAHCACGRRGCLEAYVGESGLLQSARSAGVLGPRQAIGKLGDLADAGDARARQVFARAAQRLARAAAPALVALEPEVLIVCGEGSSSWSHWDRAFRSTLAALAPPPVAQLPIEVDEWDESSWARGAGAIVLATPFDPHALAGEHRPQVLARLRG